MTANERPGSGQQRITVWLTGLPGAGKTTLARALEQRLVGLGLPCYVLDGDEVRRGLNRDLGFSASDRHENIRRIAELARLMNDAGLIAIVAVVSPYRADREMARAILGSAFREIHVSTSLAVCEARDPKGMYAKARRGEILEFTGITAPYEPPEDSDLSLDTERLDVDECVERLASSLTAVRLGRPELAR